MDIRRKKLLQHNLPIQTRRRIHDTNETKPNRKRNAMDKQRKNILFHKKQHNSRPH